MTDQKALDTAFVEKQRRRLEALREQLAGGAHQIVSDERTLIEDHGDETEEVEEAAQRSAQGEVDQAVHDADVARLRAVDRALRKIDEGSYGLSDESGKPIPRARLEATPEAILTVEEEGRKERAQTQA